MTVSQSNGGLSATAARELESSSFKSGTAVVCGPDKVGTEYGGRANGGNMEQSTQQAALSVGGRSEAIMHVSHPGAATKPHVG